MSESENKAPFESLSELEQIEGNYYKMDLFVSSALVLFTVWVFVSEKNFGWTLLLGAVAILFLIRGVKNWRGRNIGTRQNLAEDDD